MARWSRRREEEKDSPRDYPPELVEEAKRFPGAAVYEIDKDLVEGDPCADAVPPEAIKGAWPVDENGNLTGEFIPNPNYRRGRPAT